MLVHLVAVFHKRSSNEVSDQHIDATRAIVDILNVDIRRLVHVCEGSNCRCRGTPRERLKQALKVSVEYE